LLEFSEVVDPKIASNLLAMFLAFYCNLDKDVSKEKQIDGILQTLLSQSKDHKGNLASITTGTYVLCSGHTLHIQEMKHSINITLLQYSSLGSPISKAP